MRSEHKDLQESIRGGIIPATATPLTPDDEVDEEALKAHVSDLTSVDGVKGIIANAHTGECKLASREQKVKVIELHNEAAGDTPVFSGVSGDGTARVIEEARAAEEAGADGLMPLPVPAEAYAAPDVHLNYYEAIADAVDITLLNFQFPTWGSAGVPIDVLTDTCKLDQVVGFKEASFDPVRFDKTVRSVKESSEAWDDCTMITGNDTFLLHSYLLGAETALIAYGNLLPELHVEKLNAVKDGDLERAREIRETMLPLTNFIFGEPLGKYIARIKAALVMNGTFEHGTVLDPQPSLSDEEKAELRSILDDLDELDEEQQVAP